MQYIYCSVHTAHTHHTAALSISFLFFIRVGERVYSILYNYYTEYLLLCMYYVLFIMNVNIMDVLMMMDGWHSIL